MIFGNHQARPAQWMAAGLAQARRVSRISTHDYAATGFLLDGGELVEPLEGLPCFLTCNHIIPAGHSVPENFPTMDYESARLFFAGMLDDHGDPRCGFQQILCTSPLSRLDYTLLLVDRWPGAVPDLSLAPEEPSPGEKVYIFAYPAGGDTLAVTLDDNEVVGRTSALGPLIIQGLAPELGYRAPTTGGSSGGLVFNERWEAVAIHRRSDRNLQVNYGMLLGPIWEDIRRQLKEVQIGEELVNRLRESRQASGQGESDSNYFSVFISYSRQDAVFANRLYNALQANGIPSWLDRTHILPGDDIRDEISKGVRLWDKFLLCCSRNSLTSRWVESEIDEILDKEYRLSRQRDAKILALIPLDLDGYVFNWDSGRANSLRSRNVADFKGWEQVDCFKTSFNRLLEALRADPSARPAPPPSKF